jgi:hypothetical protein
MARASPHALDRIEVLLAAIRGLAGLTEKSRGVFYRNSAAYLHFHEEDGAVLADLKTRPGGAFVRFALSTDTERCAFLKAVRDSAA